MNPKNQNVYKSIKGKEIFGLRMKSNKQLKVNN